MRNLLKREQEFARELTSNRVERKATATPISDFQTMNNSKAVSKKLPIKQRDELLTALKERFEKNMNRHKGLDWAKVQARMEANAEKQWSLAEMERTGGEPDVVGGCIGNVVGFHGARLHYHLFAQPFTQCWLDFFAWWGGVFFVILGRFLEQEGRLTLTRRGMPASFHASFHQIIPI